MLSFLAQIVGSVFGSLYPAYATYKAVVRSETNKHRRLLMFWVVFTLLDFIEYILDWFLSWLPLFYFARLGLIVYLTVNDFEGAQRVYDLIAPYFHLYQPRIDQVVANVAGVAERGFAEVGARGRAIVKDHAQGMVAMITPALAQLGTAAMTAVTPMRNMNMSSFLTPAAPGPAAAVPFDVSSAQAGGPAPVSATSAPQAAPAIVPPPPVPDWTVAELAALPPRELRSSLLRLQTGLSTCGDASVREQYWKTFADVLKLCADAVEAPFAVALAKTAVDELGLGGPLAGPAAFLAAAAEYCRTSIAIDKYIVKPLLALTEPRLPAAPQTNAAAALSGVLFVLVPARLAALPGIFDELLSALLDCAVNSPARAHLFTCLSHLAGSPACAPHTPQLLSYALLCLREVCQPGRQQGETVSAGERAAIAGALSEWARHGSSAELPQWTAAKACLLTLAKYDKSDIVRRCAATAATAVHSLLLEHRASGGDKEEGEKPVVEEEQGAMARSRERSRSPGRGVGFPVAGVRPRSRPHTPLRGRFASPSLPPHSPSGPSSVPTAGKAANDAVGDIRDADHPPSDAGGDDQAMNSDAVVVRHAGTTASDAVLGSTTTDQAATAVVPTAQPVDPLMDKMSSSESGFPPSGVPFDQSAYALDAVISTHRLYRVGWHKGLGHHLRSLLRVLPPRTLSRLKPSTLPRMLLTLLLSMLSGSPPVECGEDWALALPWLEEGQAAMGQEIRDLCGKWAASFGSEEDAGPVAAFCKRMTSSTTSPVTVDADA